MPHNTSRSGAEATETQDVDAIIRSRQRLNIPFVQVPTWVLESGIEPGAFMLYVALLDNARGTAEAWPKRSSLAERLGVSVRTISNRLNQLVDAGLVTVLHQYRKADGSITHDRKGFIRQIQSVYIIETQKPDEREDIFTQGKGEENFPQDLQEENFPPRRRNISKHKHGEEYPQTPMDKAGQGELAIVAESAPPAGGGVTKRKREQYPPEFAGFWEVYPKKADKRAALKAWRAAKKRVLVSDDELIAAAKRYRDDPNRSDQFTKNAATWLNADAWENGPLPARNGNNRAQERLNNNLGVVQYFAEQEQAGNYWGELDR